MFVLHEAARLRYLRNPERVSCVEMGKALCLVSKMKLTSGSYVVNCSRNAVLNIHPEVLLKCVRQRALIS